MAAEAPRLLDAATLAGYQAIGFGEEWQSDTVWLDPEDASLAGADNNLLADVYDLENLYSVGGSLILTYNPLLSICRAEDLDEFIEQVGADVDIGDNSADYDPCYEELY